MIKSSLFFIKQRLEQRFGKKITMDISIFSENEIEKKPFFQFEAGSI